MDPEIALIVRLWREWLFTVAWRDWQLSLPSSLLGHSSAALQGVHSPWEWGSPHLPCGEAGQGRGGAEPSQSWLSQPSHPRHRTFEKTAWSSQTPADKTEEPNWQPKPSSGPWLSSQLPPAIWQAGAEAAHSCYALPTLWSQEITSIIKWWWFDTAKLRRGGYAAVNRRNVPLFHWKWMFSEFCFSIDL